MTRASLRNEPLRAERDRKARMRKLDRALKKLFPKAHISLNYKGSWQLLVAVILSAQCTDAQVNKVTKVLFARYHKIEDYVAADPREFEQIIFSTGFYKSKTKHVLAAAKRIQSEYNGHVPRIMDELLTLPGVARKTANVVLGNAFDVVEGIAVDTHVRRFAIRYDLTDSRDPDRIEQDLMCLLPREDWLTFTYRAIEYGRRIAPARVYDVTKDPLVKIYPPAGKIFRA